MKVSVVVDTAGVRCRPTWARVLGCGGEVMNRAMGWSIARGCVGVCNDEVMVSRVKLRQRDWGERWRDSI